MVGVAVRAFGDPGILEAPVVTVSCIHVRRHVIVIAMGEQPNAGFSLALADEAMVLEQGVLTVPVVWRTPGPADIVAQVLTAPCIVVQVTSTAVNSVDILKR